MEVSVKCIECDAYLEEHKTEMSYGDAVIWVKPCDCQQEDE